MSSLEGIFPAPGSVAGGRGGSLGLGPPPPHHFKCLAVPSDQGAPHAKLLARSPASPHSLPWAQLLGSSELPGRARTHVTAEHRAWKGRETDRQTDRLAWNWNTKDFKGDPAVRREGAEKCQGSEFVFPHTCPSLAGIGCLPSWACREQPPASARRLTGQTLVAAPSLQTAVRMAVLSNHVFKKQ